MFDTGAKGRMNCACNTDRTVGNTTQRHWKPDSAIKTQLGRNDNRHNVVRYPFTSLAWLLRSVGNARSYIDIVMKTNSLLNPDLRNNSRSHAPKQHLYIEDSKWCNRKRRRKPVGCRCSGTVHAPRQLSSPTCVYVQCSAENSINIQVIADERYICTQEYKPPVTRAS